MADKILQEEILSEEELEQVAGGNKQEINELYHGMAKSHFLQGYLKNSRPGNVDMDEIAKALKEKFGVDLYYNANGENLYINKLGEKITHAHIADLCNNYDRYLAYATGS